MYQFDICENFIDFENFDYLNQKVENFPSNINFRIIKGKYVRRKNWKTGRIN
jgi:hypothetical protein